MDLLQYLQYFFTIFGSFNLSLSATMSVLYTFKAKFGYRIIDGDGYQRDPWNSKALHTIEAPITASTLC